MGTPSTQTIAVWIKDALILDSWVSLRDLALDTLRAKLRFDDFETLAFLEDKLGYIADHLRDDLSSCLEEGRVQEFEIDSDTPPYIRRIAERDRELLAKLRRVDPFDFEIVCAKILEALGADSRVTQKSYDGGVDFLATRLKLVPSSLPMPISCHSVVIGQAKRYQEGSTISETRLREFIGASLLRKHTLAQETKLGPLVPTLFAFWTTSDLDANARAFAKNIGLWYMDGQTLSAYVKTLHLREFVMLLKEPPPAPIQP